MKNQTIRLSPEFKIQTSKAIFSIFLFILVYLTLCAMAVATTFFCLFLAISLVIISPSLLTIVLGFGLVSLGVLVLIFLIKFLFTSHKIDRSHLVEITRENEPKLFALIDDVVLAVGTNFPKKVYLTDNVNAAVFYDSSFWSMFFPIKKNLQIGVGLVNTVSVDEFKAILAHEFGHFSQRTMKVGSYVYNVNQVIYNMLYDNDSYHNLVQKWAGINGYIYFFVLLATKVVDAIKWILKKMYAFVNINYMALSREMEFHADEIAAHVTGYQPLKNALLRLNLSEHAFNSVIGFYSEKSTEMVVRSKNLYKEQSFVMDVLAKDTNIPISNQLPQVSFEDLIKYNKSKLVIKNQWASHPGIDERIARLEKTNLSVDVLNAHLANEVFENIDKTQEDITAKLFSSHSQEDVVEFDLAHFQTEFQHNFDQNSFSKRYNGYFDIKNPSFFDISTLSSFPTNDSFESLFSEDKVNLVNNFLTIQADMETIKLIENKNIDVRSFDYDGMKYNQKKCGQLLTKLATDLEDLQKKILNNDMQIYRFFRDKERGQSPGLLDQKYSAYFSVLNNFEERISIYYRLSEKLQFINYTTPFDQIRKNFYDLEVYENQLKERIRALFDQKELLPDFTPTIQSDFETYLSKKWVYFADENYINENLEVLYKAISNFGYLYSRMFFYLKKDLLDYQISLLDSGSDKVL